MSLSGAAHAGTTYFYTPQQILTDPVTGSSEPVYAGAKVTTSANTIDIVFVNFITDPNGDISNINAVDFQFNDMTGISLGGATMTTGAIMRTINRTARTYTDAATINTGWVLESIGNGLKINGQINPPFPAHGIIGMPKASTNRYDNANGSITTASHNPYQATNSLSFNDPLNPHYVITAQGVTSATTLKNFHVFFGTGTFLSVEASDAPEPVSFLLVGCGLLAVAGKARLTRKRRMNR